MLIRRYGLYPPPESPGTGAPPRPKPATLPARNRRLPRPARRPSIVGAEGLRPRYKRGEGAEKVTLKELAETYKESAAEALRLGQEMLDACRESSEPALTSSADRLGQLRVSCDKLSDEDELPLTGIWATDWHVTSMDLVIDHVSGISLRSGMMADLEALRDKLSRAANAVAVARAERNLA